jgi:phosphate:Na+ symporter
MIKNLVFVAGVVVLGYGLWLSPNFKTTASGIAIFLFGMMSLQRGFTFFTGGVLEEVLRSATDGLFKRLCFGFITTTLMQSSSLLSVLVISFISAGLLDLAAGIGIIYGANLGSTTSAWLVAGFGLKVKISAYAMPMLVFGVLFVFQKSKAMQGLGYILTGLGFLFLGIHYMKEGFETFQDWIDLSRFAIGGWLGLLIYVGLGIVATIVIQSSAASMVLIITALAAGQISYESSLALAIGSNIGTTVTAVLGALSSNIKGKRLAAAHLIFNLVTAVLTIFLLDYLILAVEAFSQWAGIDAQDYTLKLATFHSLFNLLGVVVMLPFIDPMAGWLDRYLPDQRSLVDQANFLTPSALGFPDTTVQAVKNETEHLYTNTVHIILKSLGLHSREVFSEEDMDQVVKRYQKIPDYDVDEAYNRSFKSIYSAIIEFISQGRFSWELKQSGQLSWLRAANLNLAEAIKDTKHLQKNLQKSRTARNVYWQQEYDKVRMNIAILLRELDKLRTHQQADDLPLLALNMLKAKLHDQNRNMIETVEQLIREQKITSQMGTSLMNDSVYVYDIQFNLIEMAATVFLDYHSQSLNAQREISLTPNELSRVVDEMTERPEQKTLKD